MSNAPDDHHTTPRWVKLLALAALIAALAIVAAMLMSGGQHGPGRHLSGAPAEPPAMRTT